MTKVKITCDRCDQEVEGLLTAGFTAGFYNVAQPNEELHQHGGAWAKFGRAPEEYICDHCMWQDPEYQRIYAYDAGMQEWLAERGEANANEEPTNGNS